MEFTEYPNMQALEQVLDNKAIYQTDRKALELYLKQAKQNNGAVRVHYEQAYYNGVPLGRYYSKASGMRVAQNQWKHVRSALFRDTETDIDIVSSQPSILAHLCAKNGILCKLLSKFIVDKVSFLNEHLDVSEEDLDAFNARNKDFLDMADFKKQIFNASLYGMKKFKEGFALKKNPWGTSGFPREIARITKAIIALPEYADIVRNIKEALGKTAHDGTYFSFILQEEERKVVVRAIEMFQEAGFTVTCYIHDGFHVLSTDSTAIDVVLQRINAEMPQTRFIKKPFRESILEMDISVFQEDKPERRTAGNDIEAAEMIQKDLAGKLVYSQGAYFMKKDNQWFTGEKEVRSLVELAVLKSEIGRLDKDGNYASYTQNHRSAVAIAACVMKLQMEQQDDKWLDAVFSSSFGYVLFENGYWSFKQGRFIPTESPDFNHDIVFMEHIPFKYDETAFTEEQLQYVHDTVFGQQFTPEIAEYYKLQLARGLAGDCMKRFLIGIGPSNSGKSTITACLAASCGGYFDGFSAANAAIKPFITDEAQAARWLYLLRFKRIIVSNELTTHIKLDGNTLKKMSNGGLDTLVGRFHHGNETKFKVGFLPIIFANDLPKISPYDDAVDNRLRSIPYTKIYASEPSNELELKANEDLDKEIEQPWFRMAFLSLLFQSYTKFQRAGRVEVEPADILKSKRDVVGEESSLVQRFLNDYEITGNPDDYVLSSDIQKWIDDNKLGMTMTRFGREMNRHCQIEKISSVENKKKKLSGKSVHVWVGLKSLSDNSPGDLEL